MDRALWLLIGLQMRGWARALGRRLQTVKGLLLALFGLFVFVTWLMMILLPRHAGLPAEQVRTKGPLYLLFYCFLNVLLASGERAVYFSPAEVAFLFPGPFTRRQLLGYKVTLTLLYMLPTSLFLTAVFNVHASWLLAAFIGVLLMTAFMQLFGMALSLAAGALGNRLYSRARRFILLAVVVGTVLLFRDAPAQDRGAILDSAAWRHLSTPLRWFFDAFLADRWLDLLRFAVLALLVDLAMLGVVFGLDADYLEAAAAYSSRVYAQMQRLRGGPAIAGGSDGTAVPSKPHWGLPMLPYLGGVGPTAWRQLTTAVRSPARLVGLVAILAIMIVSLLSGEREGRGGPPPWVMGVTAIFLSIFLTQMLPFDFRGDLDQLAALKTLPLPAWRLALGQILVPALVLTAFQWLILAGLAALEFARAPVHPAALWTDLFRLLAGATIVVPINVLLFGLENILFLLAPTRQMAGSPGDFQAMGRNVLLMMAKFVTLFLFIGTALLVGSIVYLTSAGSAVAAIAAGWVVLASSAAALVPVAGLAFTRVDVSSDKPA